MEKEEDSDDTFGGWHPIKNIKDPSLEVLAKFAISEYNKQKNSRLNFETVVSGDELEVAGMKYRLVLNVNDGCDATKVLISTRQKYTYGLGMIIVNSFT
ncbi:hypothetical protein DY000_02006319 [Brassica cretica]|uniref:Cystatin domain-containing protein n=1 Tax=Brassica cretica TaxID=69181 RepID=A0ABQ7CFA9_BRACR|nr:hypothetical protein DY000_02006319 [Brassica cretica]